MKKILTTFLSIILCASIVKATTTTTTVWDSTAGLKRVNTIGTKLLTKNNLPAQIEFKVSEEEDVNAYANINKEIYVYKGLLEYVTLDEELAAVISHEMGHIINGHCAKQTIVNGVLSSINPNTKTEQDAVVLALGKSLASTKMSRSDEFEADLSGVDLMVKAGYNPLAMISVLNKICGNYVDFLETHPSGEKRLMNIYDYVAYNYPSYIKTGFNSESYKKALTVINSNVNSRTTKQKAKIEKQQAKLKLQKVKRAKKMQKSTSAWDISYAALMLMGAE